MFDGFYKQPPRFEHIRQAVCALRDEYPFIHALPIGKSVLGRGLYALGFGKGGSGALLVGGVHGMEWLTTMLLLRFAEDAARAISTCEPLADIDLTHTLENRPFTLIPCLNPDGMEISLGGAGTAGHLQAFVEKASGGDTLHWQANARGIDLNHNFDAGFEQVKKLERAAGIDAPGPTRYGGHTPHSEPETRALVNFCAAFRPRTAYAFHSQGEEIYYRYGPHTPARSQLMAQVLASSCGYRLASPEGTASHGGFKDWFIDCMRRPGFTFEIGRGKNPLPIQEFEPIYARLVETLLIATLL